MSLELSAACLEILIGICSAFTACLTALLSWALTNYSKSLIVVLSISSKKIGEKKETINSDQRWGQKSNPSIIIQWSQYTSLEFSSPFYELLICQKYKLKIFVQNIRTNDFHLILIFRCWQKISQTTNNQSIGYFVHWYFISTLKGVVSLLYISAQGHRIFNIWGKQISFNI